jgi:hypothetical protein
MSFLYDHRKRRPQIWTYPVFVILAASIFYGFYSYGEKKSQERMKMQVNAEPEPTF